MAKTQNQNNIVDCPPEPTPTNGGGGVVTPLGAEVDARANYLAPGNVIDYTPVADTPAGTVVALDTKFHGVADNDIAAGELGGLTISGVY